MGLIEVIEPRFGLEEIGGLEPIKGYFSQIVNAIHAGDEQLVPRGITMMGPPGVGKPPGRSPGPGHRLQFRQAAEPPHQVGGRKRTQFFQGLTEPPDAHPSGGGWKTRPIRASTAADQYSGDTGVSNRLRQMRFEFTGDPAILWGKVLWIRITNRPDRLDQADLRSGRSSERIPFFMPDFTEKCHIFQVVARRSHIACDCGDFSDITSYLEARHPEVITGADIEELSFRAYRQARLAGRDQALPRTSAR